MTPEERFQEMLDKQAIHELMSRYAERIDANDPVGAAACFAEDGIGDYWGEFTGPEAIAERLSGILDQFSATSHNLSNVQITLDGETATALSYVYAFHRMAENYEPMHYWGRWVDELKKIKGHWFFARREVAGVGSIGRGDDDPSGLPGHPGRLTR